MTSQERAQRWLEANLGESSVLSVTRVRLDTLAAEFDAVREEAFGEAHEGGVLYRTIQAERTAEVERIVREVRREAERLRNHDDLNVACRAENDIQVCDEILRRLGEPGQKQVTPEMAEKELRGENERLRANDAQMKEQYGGYLDRAETAEARIEAALALHQKDRGGHCETCDECVELEHPCSTVKALRGEQP